MSNPQALCRFHNNVLCNETTEDQVLPLAVASLQSILSVKPRVFLFGEPQTTLLPTLQCLLYSESLSVSEGLLCTCVASFAFFWAQGVSEMASWRAGKQVSLMVGWRDCQEKTFACSWEGWQP